MGRIGSGDKKLVIFSAARTQPEPTIGLDFLPWPDLPCGRVRSTLGMGQVKPDFYVQFLVHVGVFEIGMGQFFVTDRKFQPKLDPHISGFGLGPACRVGWPMIRYSCGVYTTTQHQINDRSCR